MGVSGAGRGGPSATRCAGAAAHSLSGIARIHWCFRALRASWRCGFRRACVKARWTAPVSGRGPRPQSLGSPQPSRWVWGMGKPSPPLRPPRPPPRQAASARRAARAAAPLRWPRRRRADGAWGGRARGGSLGEAGRRELTAQSLGLAGPGLWKRPRLLAPRANCAQVRVPLTITARRRSSSCGACPAPRRDPRRSRRDCDGSTRCPRPPAPPDARPEDTTTGFLIVKMTP